MTRQLIYKDAGEYFFVEIYEDTVTLKVKRERWSDTWSLPLELERESNATSN
jgi:hypothetical protein